jgi:bifunctional non-homologous end joining protein LigD
MATPHKVAHGKAPSKASQLVEKQLARYREMRDFDVTAEPRGNTVKPLSGTSNLPFVIQKHAATRLHYDLRLGWRGVLKSWAVTKGPSYFPGDKRLAVQVEDHPIEYGGFEGTIPRGEYGGGTVMVWDYGDWEPLGDVDKGLADGNLKFILHGTKLQGRWVLVRMNGRAAREDKPNWLLIKERDEFTRPEERAAITDEAPNSAITKRSIEEIASSNDHVWGSTAATDEHPSSNGPVPARNQSDKQQSTARKRSGRKATPLTALLKPLPREAFPGFIEPQLAQQSTAPPEGDDWLHELKLDGYRIQIHIRRSTRSASSGPRATLFTRKGLDWTTRMKDIAHAAEQLPVESAILDGEVVVLNESGGTSFADLQAAFQEGADKTLTYFAFDLLHLDGHNLRELSLVERTNLLAYVLAGSGTDSVLCLSEHLQASGKEVLAKACALGAEGIVSKLASSPYIPGRGNAWVKSKCFQEQEFVIGGFTHPAKGGPGIGALLLGYYDAGKLQYAGRSGTGFTQLAQRKLRQQLDAFLQKRPSFAKMPAGSSRGVHWVKPELVAQISFATWTRDNLVRQAAFKGLREDKAAKEIVCENALSPEVLPHPERVKPKNVKPRGAALGRSSAGVKTLPLTHPGKVLDEESGMTKQTLAEYYLAVAEHMLPHVADRPLSVVRCPEGIGKPCFFQKHVGLGLPKGVDSIPVTNRKTGKKEDFLTLSTPEGLVGMAQMGVLEIHPWGSRNGSLEKPDRIVFDLDPDPAISWKTLAASAGELRARLKELGLESYLKSTGGKGLHVVVPIQPEHEWPVIKEFSRAVVLGLEKQKPGLYVTKMTKAIRKDHIYLDYLRNDREATSVAPFSPRARSGAPVAIPLDWKELKSETRPIFRVTDFARWERRLRRDPWEKMETSAQHLSDQILRGVDAATRIRKVKS